VTAWATITDARAAWRESSAIDDARLGELLTIATDVLTPYARPADLEPTGTPTPAAAARLREACIMHARDCWSVMASTTGDVIGFDAYALRRRPLADQVKQYLRPPTVPLVG
jgi:hypothetical protein